jgi:hypothetical protein
MNYDPNEDYSDGGTNANQWGCLAAIAVVVLVLLILWYVYG